HKPGQNFRTQPSWTSQHLSNGLTLGGSNRRHGHRTPLGKSRNAFHNGATEEVRKRRQSTASYLADQSTLVLIKIPNSLLRRIFFHIVTRPGSHRAAKC